MKRHWVYALAILVAVPRLALAQDSDYGPKLRVTPYVGVSPSIQQSGSVAIFTPSNGVDVHAYTLDYASSIPLGVNVEYRFWQRFSIVGGGAWSRRGNGTLIDLNGDAFDLDGNNLWMAKLGAGLRLMETSDLQLKHLGALIFLAPALIHDSPIVKVTTPTESSNGITQWGLNMGAEGELPLANSRFAFNLGLENWRMFWKKDDYAARVAGYLLLTNPSIDAVALSPKNTNLWILHTGLSFRF